jgi:hypothetical protein
LNAGDGFGEAGELAVSMIDGVPDEVWSLAAAREGAWGEIDTREVTASSEDVAVLVSINHDAEEAFAGEPRRGT